MRSAMVLWYLQSATASTSTGLLLGQAAMERYFVGMSMTELRIRVVPEIAGVAGSAWDACANPHPGNLGAFASGVVPPQSVPIENDASERERALAAGLVELCRLHAASSAHVTFATRAEWQLLGAQGFLQRTDQQFHWRNAGYGSFDDFLSVLAARKRKAIRRERRDAVAAGIEVHWLTGSDLTEAVWDVFFGFYMETGSRKWGRPYLTRKFYSLIGQTMADRILLVMAKRNGRFIAGAINFIGSDALYGRHWGAIEHHPFLHFELCYYQAIEYAIQHKLQRVEAGSQGEHKIARGYLPRTTYSAHYVADPGLRRAIDDFLRRERAYVAAAGEELSEAGPFRKG